jgi:hypothetical protein
MLRAAIVGVAALSSASAAARMSAEVFVCCGCGSDEADGLSARTAVDSLSRAAALARAARRGGSATVHVSGACRGPLALSAADGGTDEASRVTFVGGAGATLSNGVAVHASWLQPVTDADVLAALAPAARGSVVALPLGAHGIDGGALECRAYTGGSGCILPLNLRGSGAAELHWLGDPFNGGSASPLTLARFPNASLPRKAHPRTVAWAAHAANATVLRATLSADAAARLPAWAAQAAADAPGSPSIYVHLTDELGWADSHNPVVDIDVAHAAINITACPSSYAPFVPSGDSISAGGTFVAYNILAELDAPGEYVFNASSNTLYVWPPDASYWAVTPWGAATVGGDAPASAHTRAAAAARAGDDPVVAFVSVNASAVLTLAGASFISFDSIVVENGRGAGIVVDDSVSVAFTNVTIRNIGNMGLNVTGGSNISFTLGTIRGAGNGGAFLYGGDRATLTPAGHAVRNSTIAYNSRFIFYYAPLIALGVVGNSVEGSELYGAPQQGVYFSGNDHVVATSRLHDLVQSCEDCGAIYSGRDFTYQGVEIRGNAFARLSTPDGTDVSAVYLDDELSGVSITGNSFENVTGRALLIGGGRSNVFANNVLRGFRSGTALVHFDDRGGGAGTADCVRAGSTLAEGLAAVPYTSAAWAARFPDLARILVDAPCAARHNVVVGNSFCDVAGAPFIDQSNATIAAWESTAWGNAPLTPCE